MRNLRRENWLEKHGKWYHVFKGVLLAGIILTVLNWTIYYIGRVL